MKRTFTISCSTQNLSEIRSFSKTCLTELSISNKEANQIILAIDEVCANRIIHSNDCDESKEIELYFQGDAGNISVEIKDEGRAYSLDNYKEPEVTDIIKERKKGGMGLMLVKKIMDKVEFISDAGQNICRLSKHVS